MTTPGGPIQYSPRMSLAPYPVRPVTDDVLDAAARHPYKIAMIDGITGAEHTYDEIVITARRLGRVLQDAGVGVGDRVAIVGTNSPEWAIAFLGTLFAGGTVTTLNPLYTEREVREQFADSGPVAVFAVEATAPPVQAVWGDARNFHLLREVWVLAGTAAGDVRPVDFDPMTHLAVLPYSSGTTGAPKGVMLSHHNLTSNVRQTLGSGLIDGYSVLVNFLPFFHIYGMAVLMLPGLVSGATQITMPAFDPKRFLEIVAEYRATNLFVVPPAMLALANTPVDGGLESVRYIMSGAAPLPLDVARRVAERFDVAVVQGYGMTEASPVTHISLLGRDKEGTVGPPVADTRQKVVDLDTGAPVADRRDRRVARERAAGDAGVLRPRRRDRGVDRGGRGRSLVADRRHRHGGRGRLRHDPRPRQGDDQVQGVPDRAGRAGGGDHGASRRGGRRGDPEGQRDRRRRVPEGLRRAPGGHTIWGPTAVMAWVAERAAPYKKVREVEFVGAIPKNPSGKILRRELKAEEQARA